MNSPNEKIAQLDFQHVLEPGASAWTLLLLHGTGADEHDLLPLGRALAPQATLLSPRGKVLEQGMPRFFARLAVGQFDIPDLLRRTDELARFLEAATQAYRLDPQRIVALGFSNGANIAASLLLRWPGLLRGAALLRSVLPFEPEPAPRLDGTEVLIASGAEDPYSPPSQVERLIQILSSAGASVDAHIEPHAAHGLTQGDLDRTARWLAALTGEETTSILQ